MGKGEEDQTASGPVPDPGPDAPTAPPVPPAAEDAAEEPAAEGTPVEEPQAEATQAEPTQANPTQAEATPGAPTGDGPADAPGPDPVPTPVLGELLPPAPPVTPAPKRRRRRLRRVLVSMVVTMTVLAGAAVTSAYLMVRHLDGQITSENVAPKIGLDRPPVMPEAYGAVNILLMGSDDRTGENVKYGNIYDTTRRSDTTILLHLSADRKSSVAVSIPRDLMVQIPSCVRDDGSMSAAYKDQFNHAFEIGGSACTIKTVEQMTRVQINHHIVIDFTGFKRMVDAVDGVEVCLAEPLRDYDAKLDLDAGQQKLNGEQSLAFVRARKELGDGSDTQRMVRQQRFLASLMDKVKSDGVLFNPKKLYDLLDAGTSSITADPGLDSLDELTKLSKSVSNIPSDQSAFLTVPRQQYRYNTNRDELVQPDADALFTAIRYDRVAVGKADPGTLVEPGGSVRIDAPAPVEDAAPAPGATTAAPSSGTTQPPGRRTTSQPSGASSPGRFGPSTTPDTTPGSTTPSTKTPGSTTPGSASADGTSPDAAPTDTASPGTAAPGTASGATTAAPSPTPSVPAGPIVTVTGRTVEQDSCS